MSPRGSNPLHSAGELEAVAMGYQDDNFDLFIDYLSAESLLILFCVMSNLKYILYFSFSY